MTTRPFKQQPVSGQPDPEGEVGNPPSEGVQPDPGQPPNEPREGPDVGHTVRPANRPADQRATDDV